MRCFAVCNKGNCGIIIDEKQKVDIITNKVRMTFETGNKAISY